MSLNREQCPSPMEIANLREHFATSYRFDDAQIDIMLESSLKSLKLTLGKLEEAVAEPPGHEEISRLAHSLKGLLLNMGEHEWAELARHIEKTAEELAQSEFEDIVGVIRYGSRKLLSKS